MAEKEVKKAKTVKKVESPYASALRSLYRLLISLAFAVVIWLAYEAYSTAKVGYDKHKAQELEFKKKHGLDKEKPNQDKESEEQSKVDSKEDTDEGDGN